MRTNLDKFKQENSDKNIYSFHSAKKIYLARISSKFFLLEKDEIKKVQTISLTSRNTIVINKNGLLLFPKK